MIIECSECGAKNQILRPPQPGKRYRCGNCGAVITFLQTDDTQGQTTPIPIESRDRNWVRNMGIVNRLKRVTGTGIGCVGAILWFASGLVCLIWTLYVLFATFGVWTIFVGLLFGPITYIASIFIIWFSTGIFPVILLVPWIVSFIGLGLLAIGEKVSGE